MGFLFSKTRHLLYLGLCLVFVSCGGQSTSADYTVALDPAWYALELPGRETNITAFTIELIEAIGKIENKRISIYQRNWNNLMYGLQDYEYDAICSTMQPYLFYEKLYHFSDLYLMTGPVLVTPSTSLLNSVDQLSGKEIGILRDSKATLILEKNPAILQRTYDSLQQALIDTSTGVLDGAVVDILSAEAFTTDLFQGKLKISSPPLSEAGVRLLSLKNRPDVVKAFNRGLAKLKENGTYATLAKKWNLAEPLPVPTKG